MSRYRIKYSKDGAARFMSHLDLVRTFERAARRAGVPVVLSRGFNPHFRLSFAFPLPVGVSGLEEYVDIEIQGDMPPGRIVRLLGPVMPPGLDITGCRRLEENAPSLMSEVERSFYLVRVTGEGVPGLAGLRECLGAIMQMDEIQVLRRKKDGRAVQFDIRPGLLSLGAGEEGGRPLIYMELMAGSRINVRPGEVLSVIGECCGMLQSGCHLEIVRTRTMGAGGRDLFEGDDSLCLKK